MTDFLFAQPGFWAGMGSAIDIGGTLATYNTSDTPVEADKMALMNDWIAVGSDIRKAAETLRQ